MSGVLECILFGQEKQYLPFMKQTIRKYRSWSEVTRDTVNDWNGKTSQERLDAMQVLISRYHLFNPEPDARPFPQIYPIVKRRGC